MVPSDDGAGPESRPPLLEDRYGYEGVLIGI